jgi:hypothetical protein
MLQVLECCILGKIVTKALKNRIKLKLKTKKILICFPIIW